MNYAASKKKNILIIDDDCSVSKMLSMLLETRGYRVQVARSGKEGLDMVTATTDLILLDLVLPDQDGFEVCRKLKGKQETLHIPILILSARLLSGDIVEGLYLGADDYLTKPFEYEELVARMEAVMRRSTMLRVAGRDSGGDDSIVRELRQIIDKELIVPFYQPIFLFEPFGMLGLEALCRPITSSTLSNPELLFKAAMRFGFYHDLEILSWKKSLEKAKTFLGNEKLFLNCNPYLVEGPKFLTIKSLFDTNDINVRNIVLEITERSAVTDYKNFYQQLGHYRQHGFQFAVDDVGGGYASLESIVETKPEIVKIDRHIVESLDKDIFRRSIVKFIVSFCNENNILCIAEGIETKEVLDIVQALGVHAGQGYYLYRPTKDVEIPHMMDQAVQLV